MVAIVIVIILIVSESSFIRTTRNFALTRCSDGSFGEMTDADGDKIRDKIDRIERIGVEMIMKC